MSVSTRTVGILTIGALLLFTPPAIAQHVIGSDRNPSGNTPTADVILDRALTRAENQHDSGVELAFLYMVTKKVDTLNREGAIAKTKPETYHGSPLEGLLYEELLARDGKPLDASDSEDERERKTSFTRKARQQAAKGEPCKPNEMDVSFDRQLMNRYNIVLVGTEVMGKYECWVIAFQPKSGRLPDSRRIDKALNRSTGQIWINQNDYGVARITFDMQKPFRYVWGLVATLRKASGRLDFNRITPMFLAPVQFSLKLDLRIFFIYSQTRPISMACASAAGERTS